MATHKYDFEAAEGMKLCESWRYELQKQFNYNF
jgi:hypothetical protein